MQIKESKKSKSRVAKVAATAALAVSVGVATVVGPEKDHIELMQADPDPALLTDGAIVATASAAAAAIFTILPGQYE